MLILYVKELMLTPMQVQKICYRVQGYDAVVVEALLKILNEGQVNVKEDPIGHHYRKVPANSQFFWIVQISIHIVAWLTASTAS